MKLELSAVELRHPAAPTASPPALRSVSLTVLPGEQIAVIGPSGAGKTSLLHVAAAALRPGGGGLRLDGVDPWALSPRALQALRGRLFLAPQVPPLPPRQRVVTSVLAARLPAWGWWTSLRSLLYPSDIPAARAALQCFDLADRLFDRVDRLSGGERQRIGLARALLAPASLWLIDEPLSALDPTRAAMAMAVLCEHAQRHGHTLVATLHQVDTALARFGRIVGLRDGALQFDLPAAQVTPALLARLYAQRESAPADPGRTPAARPVPPAVMCR